MFYDNEESIVQSDFNVIYKPFPGVCVSCLCLVVLASYDSEVQIKDSLKPVFSQKWISSQMKCSLLSRQSCSLLNLSVQKD